MYVGATELGQKRATAKGSSELCTAGGAGVCVYTYIYMTTKRDVYGCCRIGARKSHCKMQFAVRDYAPWVVLECVYIHM